MGVVGKLMSRTPARVLVPAVAWQYRLSEPELGRIHQFVPKDRDAVDVGVWWGPWSWWLSRWVPRVDAFEANPQLASVLLPVMPPNVFLHSVALSDTAGESTLWIPGGGTGTEGRASLESARTSGANWGHQTVETRRLDDFDLGDVGFVKIDVEGHELAVLKGATELLSTQRPVVFVEIEEHTTSGGQFDDIVKFLCELSYEGKYLLHRRWHPIEDLDRTAVRQVANRVATHGYITNILLYARHYAHNFVFTPKEPAGSSQF
jgi:FkbM family methyltransferase